MKVSSWWNNSCVEVKCLVFCKLLTIGYWIEHLYNWAFFTRRQLTGFQAVCHWQCSVFQLRFLQDCPSFLCNSWRCWPMAAHTVSMRVLHRAMSRGHSQVRCCHCWMAVGKETRCMWWGPPTLSVGTCCLLGCLVLSDGVHLSEMLFQHLV